jgi:D-alanyl-D-alanine-carboxypeptidase/D-alanyl-D-alanine-endopeptidase
MAIIAVVKIGKNLRAKRVEKFISQAELAEASGLSGAHVGRIERNEVEPHLSTIRKLAQALGVEPQELVEGDGGA